MENEIEHKILKEQEECEIKKEREVKEAKAEVRLRREMGEQIPCYLLVLSGEILSPASRDFQFGKPQGDFTSHTSSQFPGIVSTNALSHALKIKHEIKTEKVGPEAYVSALKFTCRHLISLHQMRRKCTFLLSNTLSFNLFLY